MEVRCRFAPVNRGSVWLVVVELLVVRELLLLDDEADAGESGCGMGVTSRSPCTAERGDRQLCVLRCRLPDIRQLARSDLAGLWIRGVLRI